MTTSERDATVRCEVDGSRVDRAELACPATLQELARPQSEPRRKGRPFQHESKKREERFIALLAEGESPREAGRESRIDPWRAFSLATDPATSLEFWRRVGEAKFGAQARAERRRAGRKS